MISIMARLADQGATAGGPTARLLSLPLVWAVLTIFVGLWLLLPRARRWPRWPGGLVALAGLVWLGVQLQGLADPLGTGLFGVLAAVTLTGCLATVTSRNPVYSAIWFAQALLGVAGLMMFDGAQFLGMATVVVYVGAIVVTLLFVLMLARPDGRAQYDRRSWEALLSAATGAALVGMLTVVVARSLTTTPTQSARPAAVSVTTDMVTTDMRSPGGVLAAEHTAHLGARLYGQHLIAVDVAGVLLLVALVGAAAITQAGARANDE